MPDVTISEIAERIRRPDEDLGVVIDRLQSWVREGLLLPAGEKNPGTGRHRIFPQSAVIDALILHTLVDQIGMRAVKARKFKKVFDASRTSFIKPETTRFVIVGRSRNNRAVEMGFANAKYLTDYLERSSFESLVVINLHQLFKRLEP
jgi:DNA-binding transcriptional MerR regulator